MRTRILVLAALTLRGAALTTTTIVARAAPPAPATGWDARIQDSAASMLAEGRRVGHDR